MDTGPTRDKFVVSKVVKSNCWNFFEVYIFGKENNWAPQGLGNIWELASSKA